LQSHRDDTVAKGAKLTIVGADKTPASKDNRCVPLHILPVMTYAGITEVPDKIEPRDNSLAMCRFGRDKSEQPYLLSDVQSDRSCINDIRLHYAQEGLPFF